jgi:hypothetical protein
VVAGIASLAKLTAPSDPMNGVVRQSCSVDALASSPRLIKTALFALPRWRILQHSVYGNKLPNNDRVRPPVAVDESIARSKLLGISYWHFGLTRVRLHLFVCRCVVSEISAKFAHRYAMFSMLSAAQVEAEDNADKRRPPVQVWFLARTCRPPA